MCKYRQYIHKYSTINPQISLRNLYELVVDRILRKSKFNLKQKGKVGIFYICWFSTAEFPNTRWFEIYFQILKYENVSSLLGFQVTDSICHPLHWNSHFVTSMIWTHHHISGGCQVSHINLEDFKQIYISLRKNNASCKRLSNSSN